MFLSDGLDADYKMSMLPCCLYLLTNLSSSLLMIISMHAESPVGLYSYGLAFFFNCKLHFTVTGCLLRLTNCGEH